MKNLLKMVITVATAVVIMMDVSNKIPRHVFRSLWINSCLCFAGWEALMSLGAFGSWSAQERSHSIKNDMCNAVVMSAGDGLIGAVQVIAVLKWVGPQAFKKWDWKALAIMLAIGVGQNIVVGAILDEQIAKGKISLAPMIPIPGPNWLMNQEPWIIQPFLFYAILIRFNKAIFA